MPNTIPSEFRSFVRDVGIRAFDRLAGRAGELDTSLRTIVRGWGKLSSQQKESLLDELIETARLSETAAEPPAPRERAPRTIKRYDPEEVEKTLPAKKKLKAKPKAKARAKAAPKAKGKSAGTSKKQAPSPES
jgi:hypothetical protein